MWRWSFILGLCVVSGVHAVGPAHVVELFEDDTDTLIPQLTNTPDDNFKQHKAEPEKADVLTGKVALRVGSFQRFQADMKGWKFPITKEPKAGEYRFVRFAWKKMDSTSMMFQLASNEEHWEARWNHRYYVGPEAPRWEAKHLSKVTPQEWVVVTRDLVADFGEFTLTGIAFSPLDYGSEAIFDHVLIGRSIEDLDRYSAKAFKSTPSPKPLTTAQIERLRKQFHTEPESVAYWQMLTHRQQVLPFLKDWITTLKPQPTGAINQVQMNAWLDQLKHHRFTVREQATNHIIQAGIGAIPLVDAALQKADDETKIQLRRITAAWQQGHLNNYRTRERLSKWLAECDEPTVKPEADKLAAQLAEYAKLEKPR